MLGSDSQPFCAPSRHRRPRSRPRQDGSVVIVRGPHKLLRRLAQAPVADGEESTTLIGDSWPHSFLAPTPGRRAGQRAHPAPCPHAPSPAATLLHRHPDRAAAVLGPTGTKTADRGPVRAHAPGRTHLGKARRCARLRTPGATTGFPLGARRRPLPTRSPMAMRVSTRSRLHARLHHHVPAPPVRRGNSHPTCEVAARTRAPGKRDLLTPW